MMAQKTLAACNRLTKKKYTTGFYIILQQPQVAQIESFDARPFR
jgi:hypothetical protein